MLASTVLKKFQQSVPPTAVLAYPLLVARRSAAVLAVAAMLLMVTGPVLSHHYAEISPYHTHVFLSDVSADQHSHDTVGHHDEGGESGILSVSDSSAAGSGPVQFVVSSGTPLTPHLMTSFEVYEVETVGADGFMRPPERPPRYS